jgi:hypothetical protein
MEDILAIVVVLATVGLIYGLFKYIGNKQKAHREKIERQQRESEEYFAKLRAKSREAAMKKTLSTPPPTPKVSAAPSTPMYAPSPTQSMIDHNDNFLSDVAMGMVINSLLNSNHNSQSGVVTEDRQTGSVSVKVNESSWGFDDSDSRKSVSDTFSSSSSSSSSDSWSSSSSDSFSSSASSDW